MRINEKTRQLWAEKTMELMNIGAGALLFGQLLSGQEFSLKLAFGGLALVVGGYLISLVLLRKK